VYPSRNIGSGLDDRFLRYGHLKHGAINRHITSLAVNFQVRDGRSQWMTYDGCWLSILYCCHILLFATLGT